MFGPTSRYANLPILIHVSGDQEIAYVSRRFIPPPDRLQPLGRITVRAADRPDHLASTAYGDPTQYWRVADANGTPDIASLSVTVGRKLVIPVVTPPDMGD